MVLLLPITKKKPKIYGFLADNIDFPVNAMLAALSHTRSHGK